MSSRRPALALFAVVALARCGSATFPIPAPGAVTPNRGFTGNATPIVIHGSGFSVRTVQPSSGGAPTVDETFQAWLDDDALVAVRRVDEQTLNATVPPGLTPGLKTLRIQGPFGTSGELAQAFTVEGTALASISLVIAAAPPTVSEGQSITVTLTVTNTGSTVATDAIPDAPTVTGTGAATLTTGPDPSSIGTLAPGDSGTFTWTYLATTAGTLSFSGAAHATDTFSLTTISGVTDPAKPATVTVQHPAALSASFPASGSAALGQDFPVTMTVTNTGGATVQNVVPAAPVVNPTGMATLKVGTGAVPASVPSLNPGDSASFTWTFVAGSTPGTVRFSTSASGTDANSGAPVTSATATSGNFTIGAAGMNATLTASPATTSVGQAVTLTLKITNPGLADVRSFTVGAPSVTSTDGANATLSSGPTPAPPAVLAAGQTVTITWTYSPGLTAGLSTGHLSYVVTASGVDAFSGGAITTQPTASSTVQAPAALTATLTPSRNPPVPNGQPFTVDTGQVFTYGLTVSNTGGASALSVTATAIPGCAVPSPVSATVDPGTPVVFTYASCSSSSSGTLTASASASGTDVNNPSLVVSSNTATATVVVQTPAIVSATTLTTTPATLSSGQGFTVTLTLTKSGAASANVTAVSLTGTTCTTPPVTPLNGIGSTVSLTWSGCTAPGTPQTLNLGGSASWQDANTGVTQTAGPATAAVQVVAPALVSATSITTAPGTLSTGQTFTITLTLTKSGTAAANVTGASMSDAAACQTAPTFPINGIPVTQTLVWAGCTAPATAGPLALAGSANWVDANNPTVVNTTNLVAASITVQAAAGLAAAYQAQPPATVSVGQPLPLTVNVTNTAAAGGAAANTVTVTAATTGTATASCTAVSPGASTINAGAALPYTFTCTPLAPGTLSIVATASGTAANSGNGISASATTSPATTVQAAAALAVTFAAQPPGTVNAGQVISLTANVRNTAAVGGASATSVTVAPTVTTVTGTASATCGAVSPGASTLTAGATLGYGFSCTTSGAGTLSLTATANGTAANSGNALTAAATTSPATTVLPPVVISPATANVPPRGSQAFTASGGTGTGYAWSLPTNASGGSIDATTGAYTAGATPNVTDVVRVQDSLGNATTRNVAVGPGVSISGVTTVPPRGSATFTASGGSGTGFVWSLSTNASGGAINASTGAYTAGATPNVTDVVRVQDSLGNAVTQNVAVGAGVSIAGATTIVPRASTTFTASGGSGTGFAWSLSTNASGGSIDASTGAYTAGATPNVTDVVRVQDSLGNSTTHNVTVGAGVTISGVTTIAPRGSATFTASGGSGTGFVWSLPTNASGGSINASTGAYTAGPTPSVVDVVRVQDSLGNSATQNVAVGAGVTISGVGSIAPRGSASFNASGGSGTGFAWSLSTNASGGSINAGTGAYTAGATPNVTDVVRVQDSLGNSATQNVAVGAGVSITGATTIAPRGSATFTASGGSGTGFSWSLSTNASGGSINPGTGAYTAGATPNVTDVVRVQDSLGNAATQNVTVGPGVSISGVVTIAPLGSATFTASGGSGTGFAWSLSTNASGGSINASTGAYTAGATPNVTDVVRVQDSLGNAATQNVAVGAGVSIAGVTTIAPQGAASFTASGGSGAGFVWSLSVNASGGSINASTGAYTAGATPNVTDVVRVQDSLGNAATHNVAVGPGVSIAGVTTIAPQGTATFTASGGSGAGFVWSLSVNGSGGSINASTGAYTAGLTPNVTDVVRVQDSLGNAATHNVTVGAGVTISGVGAIAPRGSTTFTASGGSGTGFSWSLSTNASGGSINASTGAYTAGATPNVTDVVRVQDSLGNSATHNVAVGAGVAISGVTSIAPRGSATFTASGGSGTGFSWSLSTNASGGSINAGTGAYTAGATPNVTDVVRVQDSLGNAAAQSVTVGPAVGIAGPTSIAPLGTATFTASGGSGTGFSWSLSMNASGGSIDVGTGAYTAGGTPNVTDVVLVQDSLGNVATQSVTVGAGVSISGSSSIAPRGSATFGASGGSGTGFSWSLSTNASGGSINASTGAYTAGPTPNVTDVVRVQDSLGNSATQSVAVGPGISIFGPASVAALGTAMFSASGGSGTGFGWSLTINASGGSIDPGTGAYTAGPTSNVTDVVQVVDSLGNSAATSVSVTP